MSFPLARRRHLYTLACVLLFVASLLRYWVSYDPGASVPRDPESFRLAHNLYEKGQFANPFAALATGPSAHLAPVFPAFLALLMRSFGDKGSGFYAVNLAAALILSLQLALYPVFSKVLGMGALNGIIGASIWIVAKPRFLFGFEGIYAAIILALACSCYRRYLDSQAHGPGALGWVVGCLMGLSILTIPTAAPIFAVWLGWEMWRRKIAFLKKCLLPFVLLPTAIVTPWTIRNYAVFHRFILVRDDFGLELSASNNDCAQFSMVKNFANGCFDAVHPNHNVNEAKKVLELGEPGYNERRLLKALRWISGHPARFIKLSAQRFIAFWLPTETLTIHYAGSGRRLERGLIYVMTLLSGLGLVILYRRDSRSAAVCMSCLAVFPLVYYIVQYGHRYRYPIMWVTFLLGALPITAFMRPFWEAFSSHPYGRAIKSGNPSSTFKISFALRNAIKSWARFPPKQSLWRVR